MTNKNEPLHIRYADLLPEHETADSAFEQLLADLEIIYPPAPYPTGLPGQLLSALETRLDQDEIASSAQPVSVLAEHPRLLKPARQRRKNRWQRILSLSAATILTTLLVSSLLLILHQSRQTTTGTSTQGDLSNFVSLEMMNPTTGWALVENQQGTRSALLHTSDGGAHWKAITPHQFSAPVSNTFYALNTTTAWVAGEIMGVSHQLSDLLLRTTDSGKTWQTISLPANISNRPIADVSFWNAEVGWIEVQPSSIPGAYTFWLTRDGGKSWHQFTVPAGAESDGAAGGFVLTYFSEQTWALTNTFLPLKNGHPIVYLTRDAGSTWQEELLPAPAGLSLITTNTTAHFQVFSKIDGLLAILDGQGHFFTYATHTGGVSWQLTTVMSIGPEYGYDGWPHFSDKSHGTMFEGPYMDMHGLHGPRQLNKFVTSDGGLHWQTAPVTLPGIPQGQMDATSLVADFVSPRIGWLAVTFASSHSNFYRTLDSGQTWQEVYLQIN